MNLNAHHAGQVTQSKGALLVSLQETMCTTNSRIPIPPKRHSTAILGGWVSDKRFENMESTGASMMTSLPFHMQLTLAKEQADHEAAIEHIHLVAKKAEVVALLKRIGMAKAVKRERNRFVGLNPVIATLFKADMVTW
jgi:hypothetical protein